MAKGPSPAPATAAPAPVAVAAAPLFTVSFGDAPPIVARKVGIEASPYSAVMKGMSPPTDGKFAQFFIPAGTAPATITDAAEQAKWRSADARKITNRVSGIARRLHKQDASLNYALRTKEENGVLGVRVYRVASPTPAA